MTEKLIKASFVRALWTLFETAVAIIGTASLLSEVNWAVVLSGSLLAALLAFLKCMATGLPEVEKDIMDDEDFDLNEEEDDEEEEYDDEC